MKVENEKISRWHPKFLLNSVPDIEPAELPTPPDGSKEPLTAKDVLKICTGRPNSVVSVFMGFLT